MMPNAFVPPPPVPSILLSRAAPAVFVAALLIASSTPPAATVAVPQTSRPAVSIPFELATRHVIVSVSVNRSRPLSFVLDTGADRAIIRLDVAKQLGLRLEGAVKTGGAGPGTQMGSRVRNATWSLAGHDAFVQPVTMAFPLPGLSAAMGRDVDGIIGGEFIKQFVVELDYQARSITLHDPAAFEYTGRGETLPLEFTSNTHPVLRAAVTPIGGQPLERRFVLDIGSGLALALHSPFVAEQNLLGEQSKTIRLIGGAGAGGRTVGRLGRVASLQIGSFTISNPITLFSEDKGGAFANPSLAGNIGAQIASRFRLFLDYGRRRLILEATQALSEPFDRAFSGMSLRAEGTDYRTFRVHEVLEGSPATDAGIEVGDIIASIDGTPADRLTLSTINAMLEQPRAYDLTVVRGQRTITVTLTPRRLV